MIAFEKGNACILMDSIPFPDIVLDSVSILTDKRKRKSLLKCR